MTALELHLDPDPEASAEALIRAMSHRRFLGEYADHDLAHEAATAWAGRILPRARLMRIRAGDAECGHVWIATQGDDLAVVALALDDHDLAADVRIQVLDLAREEGVRRLTLGVAPGDPVLEAFARGGGFEVSAVQMRLDLDHPLPAEPRVALEPMGADDYAAWEADEIESYAEAREKSGETPERALETSREQHAELLPDGLTTRHHHFFVGRVDGEVVGTLWLGSERPMVFVYDVGVHEDHQRRGYGAGLMRGAALWSRDHGSHALGLNVFGYNHAARALYDKLGYHVVESFVAHALDLRAP